MNNIIKTNKIGLFTDLHIGLNQDSDFWHGVALNFGKWCSETFNSKGISDIFICGDVFHNRSDLSLKTIDTAKKFFDLFKDFHLYIVVGNHDCWKKDQSDINSVTLLSEWSNITVIDKEPKLLASKNKKTISFIPWATPIENIPKSDICIGHFDIQSFYMNGFKLSEKGFKSEELFEKSTLIISGHYHKKQERDYKNGKIVYLGSPYQHNFGDILDQRGVHILDLDTLNFEFLEYTDSPKHYKILLSDILNKKINVKNLKEILPKNIIKFIIDEDIDFTKKTELISKLKNMNPANFVLDYYLSEKTNLNVDILSISDKFNIEDTFKTYIENMDISSKEELLEYVTKVYNKIKK